MKYIFVLSAAVVATVALPGIMVHAKKSVSDDDSMGSVQQSSGSVSGKGSVQSTSDANSVSTEEKSMREGSLERRSAARSQSANSGSQSAKSGSQSGSGGSRGNSETDDDDDDDDDGAASTKSSGKKDAAKSTSSDSTGSQSNKQDASKAKKVQASEENEHKNEAATQKNDNHAKSQQNQASAAAAAGSKNANEVDAQNKQPAKAQGAANSAQKQDQKGKKADKAIVRKEDSQEIKDLFDSGFMSEIYSDVQVPSGLTTPAAQAVMKKYRTFAGEMISKRFNVGIHPETKQLAVDFNKILNPEIRAKLLKMIRPGTGFVAQVNKDIESLETKHANTKVSEDLSAVKKNSTLSQQPEEKQRQIFQARFLFVLNKALEKIQSSPASVEDLTKQDSKLVEKVVRGGIFNANGPAVAKEGEGKIADGKNSSAPAVANKTPEAKQNTAAAATGSKSEAAPANAPAVKK